MEKVVFGLIGYGAWGRHHARAIAGTPDAQLAAIAARSESSRTAAAADHPRAEIVADYRALLRRADIEVVSVVLPSDLHREVGKAVLEAGKHLLLEKPMALSVADCEDLIATARRHSRLIAIGHEMRFSSLWRRVKELIDSGAIGEPLYAMIELWRRPYRLGAEGWRYAIDRVGNWILEEPIHFFDLARWYLERWGNPTSVFARANASQAARPELQDNFSTIVTFPGGAYAVISQSLAAYEHHQTVKLTGTKVALWASWSGAMDRTFTPTFSLKHFDGEHVREIPISRLPGEVFELEDQAQALVRALRSNGKLGATGEDGKWSVALCLAAAESVKTNQIVTIGAAPARAPV